MSAARKLVQFDYADLFEGEIGNYLSSFFGHGHIPPAAMAITTWDDLQNYLASHVIIATPAKTNPVQHRVYGFEKDHLPALFLKHVLY